MNRPWLLPCSILNIPTDVFYNLIDTFKKNLPVWHRYFEIRRKVLGLRKLAYYDMWAPITKKKVKVPFEKGVELICESLAPMGREYVETVRKGVLKTAGWMCIQTRARRKVRSRGAHREPIHSSI
jgi:oligoendopeptidase F